MKTFADENSRTGDTDIGDGPARYTFIVNPNSRSGLGRRIWSRRVEPVLRGQGIPYRAFFTKYRQHAAKISRKITEDREYHTIIVLGGDGTINEVVNGITDLTKTTLGYIPTGSSNDFARSLGLPTDPVRALCNILSPSCHRQVDIGILTYDGGRQRFAVSSGIGFDAGICHEAMDSPLKPLLNQLRLGKLTYVGIALRQILTLAPGQITVTLDGERRIRFKKAYFAAAMNQPYEGGGFRFCPDADCRDGLLDVIVISGLSRLKILALLPTAYKGWHSRFRGVHLYTCRKMEIESVRPLPVHTDGEPVFLQTKVSMSLESEKLRMIAAPL